MSSFENMSKELKANLLDIYEDLVEVITEF